MIGCFTLATRRERPCLDNGMNAGQMEDIVKFYLRDHPEKRHLEAAGLVIAALKESSPATEKIPTTIRPLRKFLAGSRYVTLTANRSPMSICERNLPTLTLDPSSTSRHPSWRARLAQGEARAFAMTGPSASWPLVVR
jgi:hypothetical protein